MVSVRGNSSPRGVIPRLPGGKRWIHDSWIHESSCAARANYFIMQSMKIDSKRTSLALLVITAFACSRTLFFLFHDPEGPNLLIVTVLALLLYGASFITWLFIPTTTASKKLLFAIGAQLLIVTGLYTIA